MGFLDKKYSLKEIFPDVLGIGLFVIFIYIIYQLTLNLWNTNLKKYLTVNQHLASINVILIFIAFFLAIISFCTWTIGIQLARRGKK